MDAASVLHVDRLAWDRTAAPVSFATRPGERLYLCGEGATRLLLTLAGFAEPAAGAITCDGRDITRAPAALRHVAYIPAGDSLIGRRSLLENVRLAGGAPQPAAEALQRLGLADVGHRAAASLSPAQRRLGALARALAMHPAVLLVEQAEADPPAIPQALAAAGPTALVACADAKLALARADRILLLQGQAPAQLATPVDLYERPGSARAARWSGACNLIPATLAEADTSGSLTAHVAGQRMAARFRTLPGTQACLVVRPHFLVLAPESGLAVTVVAVDYRGARTRIRLDSAAGPMVMDTADPPPLSPGAATRVNWRWQDAWPVPPEATP